MREFWNHLQIKDVHKDTATVPAPINKVQDWHSIPSGYTSYSCTQSWVTLDTSVLPQQQRNTVCDSALCHGPYHALMCSAPKSSPGQKCRSTIAIIPNTVDTGMIQNYLSEIAKLRDHILPLSCKSHRTCDIECTQEFSQSTKRPGSTQLWWFIWLFLRRHIWNSCFLSTWVLQEIITTIQRVKETMHCRESWCSQRPEKIFKMLWDWYSSDRQEIRAGQRIVL